MLDDDDQCGVFTSVVAAANHPRTSKVPIWLGLLLLALAFAVDLILSNGGLGVR